MDMGGGCADDRDGRRVVQDVWASNDLGWRGFVMLTED